MVKKSFMFFVIGFLIYNLVLFVWDPSFISSQGFWQDNQIKAQDYIYENESKQMENIIVGSSMSFRLVNDSLKDFSNLAFLGEGYTSGLNLISKNNIYPKRVFIETNFPSKQSDEGVFNDVLYNPVLYPLRKVAPALRDGKQPILVVTSQIEKGLLDILIEETKKDKYSAIFKTLTEPTPGLGLYAGFEKEVDAEEMKDVYDELEEVVNYLEARGTEIVFFEMPFYKTLHNSPRVRSIRKCFREAFPPEKYIYLPSPKEGEYQTLDGLHLGQEESLRFTLQFRARVDSLKLIGK